MRLALIAAVADNGVIGRANDLPWRLPADLRRFKRLTLGHHLVVGRKTWQAIGRPLPGRTMVVLTRAGAIEPAGALCCGSLSEALAIAARAGDDEPFVAGGEQVYRLALPRADRLYLTRVHATPQGDARFPDLDLERWLLVSREERPADRRNPHAMTFELYERPPSSGGGSRFSSERSSSRLK